MLQGVSYCLPGPGFLYHQTKRMLLSQPIESVRLWVLGGVGVKCPGCWISLCDLLKAPFTGPFLEASGNRVSDFGAKEIREQTEAKLLVPRCDLVPILRPSSLEFSENLPRGVGGSWREHKQGRACHREAWNGWGWRQKGRIWRQNIWGSMTNAWENSGFPYFSIVSKNEKHILCQQRFI